MANGIGSVDLPKAHAERTFVKVLARCLAAKQKDPLMLVVAKPVCVPG